MITTKSWKWKESKMVNPTTKKREEIGKEVKSNNSKEQNIAQEQTKKKMKCPYKISWGQGTRRQAAEQELKKIKGSTPY